MPMAVSTRARLRIKPFVLAAMAAPALLLTACDSGSAPPADPAKTAEARRAAVSITDPRMPAGFTIFSGDAGQVREFAIAPVGGGRPGDVATFSVVGQPAMIRQFYEDQAVANGMAVEGRVSAGEFMSVDARRSGDGTPHTFSAMAVKKGEYTNVTLQFDVVP